MCRAAGSDAAVRGPGVLSLAVGAMEIAAARALARMLGMRSQEDFIRICGARVSTPWIRARVAGDVLDISTTLAEHHLGQADVQPAEAM